MNWFIFNRYKPKTKTAWTEKTEGTKKPGHPRQDNTQRRGTSGDSSLFDFEKNPANFSYDEYLKKQYVDLLLIIEQFFYFFFFTVCEHSTKACQLYLL